MLYFSVFGQEYVENTWTVELSNLNCSYVLIKLKKNSIRHMFCNFSF